MLFEIAARNKYRFPTSKGLMSVEDIWDLPLKGDCSLNSIALVINNFIKSVSEDFVDDKPFVDKETINKLDIVKHIISVVKEENAKKMQEYDNALERKKIMAILAEKDQNTLKKSSKATLENRLKELS